IQTIPADGSSIALGTAQGVVKRVADDVPNGKDIWPVISLRPGDRVVGAAVCSDHDDLVFVTNDAQLLRFQASAVRPQGRAAGGMAGIRLAADASAVFFGAVAAEQQASAVVITVAGAFGQLAGTSATSAKVTGFAEFPRKGRATSGVRCQRLVKGEAGLVLAWVGPSPARAETDGGRPVGLPDEPRARDAAGAKLTSNLISRVGGTNW
ncbi:MAG: DNA gyrase C-terminal beta-propeller domain-containing protein, partial [Actinomycetes bacterium]